MALYFSEYFKQSGGEPAIARPGEPGAQLSAVKIANDFVDEEYLRRTVEQLTTPDVGELKFLSVPDLAGLASYESYFTVAGGVRTLKAASAAEFDGWVFPDGAKYSASDSSGNQAFADAYYEFRTVSQDGVFNVPTLSNFMKLNPGADTASPYARHEYSNPVPRHSHTYTGSSTGADRVVNDAFYIYMTEGYDSAGEYIHKNNRSLSFRLHTKMDYDVITAKSQLSNYAPGFHAGDYSPDAVLKGVDVTIQRGTKVSSGSAAVYPASNMGETYPAYDRLPVMIYIGKAV